MPMNGRYTKEELETRTIDTNDLIAVENTYKEKMEEAEKEKQWRLSNFKKWVWFYRNNPHRAIKDYFGINLKLFQIIIIYMIHHYPMFMWIASRSSGKSFLIAIYAIYRSVFYPGTKVVISAGTKSQAILMIKQYCKTIIEESPMLLEEVKEISVGIADPKVEFYNGSRINAVAPTHNSRGYRANVLILEEFVQIKKEIVDAVLKHFKTTPRQPPYADLPEYKGVIEENKEIYISSAWLTKLAV